MTSPPKEILDKLNTAPSRISLPLTDAPALRSETPLANVAPVASYNWLSKEGASSSVPTIQVPGIPPIVSFPEGKTVLTLKPDSGLHYVDQNAVHLDGKSGMIPGLAAAYAYNPNFKIEDYDVITDRNGLLKLFEIMKGGFDSGPVSITTAPTISTGRYAHRTRGGRGSQWFNNAQRQQVDTRIDVDVVAGYDPITADYIYDPNAEHQVLVMTRWEPNNHELIQPEVVFKGFGMEFQKATTTFLEYDPATGRTADKGADEVTGFHAMVSYELFGLRVLVRFHADGCNMTRAEFVEWAKEEGLKFDPAGEEGNGDAEEGEEKLAQPDDGDALDLLDTLSSLGLSGDKKNKGKAEQPTVAKSTFGPIEVAHTPNTIFPIDRLLQIKTRGSRGGLEKDIGRISAQLFFGQTQHMYFAQHNRGTFVKYDVQNMDLSSTITQYATAHGTTLKKLVQLLDVVKEKAVEVGGSGALVLKYTDPSNAGSLTMGVHKRILDGRSEAF